MTATDIAQPARATIARIGLGARALVYFAVSGLLIGSTMTSKPDDGASPGDAFKAIENETGGQIILIGLAIGLFLYALWRFEQAVLDADNQGTGAKGILARMGMASSGLSYLLIGVAAYGVATDTEDSGGGGKTEETARWLMEQPFGRYVVAAGGVILVAIGCAQIWRARSGQWKKRIDLIGWAGKLTPLIAAGIGGRGLLFIAVGGFLLLGSATADPGDIKGLAGTLGWIRYQPFGLWLFIASALAIGVYGVYSGVQSLRYRFPEE